MARALMGMTIRSILGLLFITVVFCGHAAYAQQPGVDCVPVQGNGWQGCMPTNNAAPPTQQQAPQPPARWASQWGAIATDNQLGKLGASMNGTDQASAEASAVSECQSQGGTQCRVLISFHDQCGVVIIGDGKINASSAATVAQASDDGIKTCNAGATHCHVYYSACALPVRIQ
ncbi:DUF4189 domain-containing protein [Burkholderia cepacia]|uniref:DUF4189 domain-containing protein n=1 Tax=Burkholderia cepacia TaxID=292 RepID=UPI00158E9851|nr:DUF4189 domain-containing protein [Burkholderia cepacia]